MENATEEELSNFQSIIGASKIDRELIKKLKEITINLSEVERLRNNYSEILYRYDDKGRMVNSCADQCFLDSHEIWFDIYMATDGHESLANVYSAMYYAGCLNGCRYAGQ